MKFIIATHNMKKRAEMERILSPLGIEVLTAEMAGITLTDVPETGETFEENAVLKAESGCRESGMPCIADDSGLAVDFLGGAPGVYSARYSGVHGNDEANIQKLLKNLEDAPEEKRTARFVCTVCVCFPDGRKFTVCGKCEGKIGFEKHGNGGFHGWRKKFCRTFGSGKGQNQPPRQCASQACKSAAGLFISRSSIRRFIYDRKRTRRLARKSKFT